MRRLIEAGRDLLMWGVPILTLVLAVFVFNVPLWFAVPLALVLLAALYFVLNSRGPGQQEQVQLRLEVEQALRQARENVNRIHALAAQVQKQNVRDTILKISAMADGVIGELLAKPDASLVTATRLKYTFAQTYDIVKFYGDLTNNRVTTTPEKRALLTAQIENNVLDQLQTSIHDFAVAQDRNEVNSLEVAIRTLENTLKLEGLS